MELRPLKDEIDELISLEAEGGYWDFKLKWHENKASLLHDIICMANNLENRDAYIIVGVSDSKSHGGVEVKGVSDENRKDQQQLITFLRDKKFAGGVRPTVYVQTLSIGNKNIDIVTIKNTHTTPYFLTDDFTDGGKTVHKNYVYTRIGDTNTPIDKSADIDKLEKLWRKRFGIDLTIQEKMLYLLSEPAEWEGSFNDVKTIYHSRFPEFQIRVVNQDNDRENGNNAIITNIADQFSDVSYETNTIEISFHTTVLYRETIIYLDGCNHLIPMPSTYTVSTEGKRHSLTYQYFDKSTVGGKLFICLAGAGNHWYGQSWKRKPGNCFLEFSDSLDKERFDIFVMKHLAEVIALYHAALKKINMGNAPSTEEYFHLSGWSKGCDIIAQYLFEMYRGIEHSNIGDYLP